MSEATRTVKLVNKLGLHARAASKLVALANTFDAEAFLAVGDREVNAKSILGVMMLAAAKGTELRLRCVGAQAEAAATALVALVEGGFGET
jgi:phosphocarrier protein